jgi:hypothetical protein
MTFSSSSLSSYNFNLSKITVNLYELKLELEKVMLDMVNLYELKLELEKVMLDMVNLYELKLELKKVILIQIYNSYNYLFKF